ncbi:hypothetical protein [Actinacidiphila bryophytorum]|uniref:hypothetical protein n=1 Tax=Actinacidiphila bryophytorum TaxID=1436133 RepID=UPI00195F5EDD|nr:hypothetical protein [Actinacidiphila bryophytorum]MBM9438823.1 hypothetical protein [Actinacidiphila bryophytorum]MBN6545962.1 hypothetical protein [Actinacidiphila bryophytorum]
MGSLRNPVGPLPSTIYWRRRVVVFALVALIAALVIWAVTSGGGGSGNSSSAPTGSHTPAASITPGPVPSGTHISGRPGGRETAPSDGGTGADGGTGDGTSAGATAGDSGGGTTGATSGTTAGTSAGADGGTGTPGGGTGGASAGTGASGDQVPAGSTLPDCSPGTVTLSLTSAQNTYAPGEDPVFQLHATNSGTVTCKVDFGPRNAVFTVTKTPDDSHVWASDDCPASTASYLLQVPAHGSTTYTLHWNGRTSSPHCATPKGGQAAPGNYLAQAQLPGYGTKSVPFVLSQD